MLLGMIAVGQCIVALNGPWRFHTGDDPRWADPRFEDAGWETVDLTPALGAHDPDVGFSGYVTGWTAKGHAKYSGVAWYRLRVPLGGGACDTGDTLAILGPLLVDDGYRVFVNGASIGQAGVPYSMQPRMFALRPMTSLVIAIRVRAEPGTVRDSPDDAGGIHIAPALGGVGAVRDRYAAQWAQTLWGYVVDAIEPVAFAVLAILVMALGQPWMAGALVLSAVLRLNQVTFYWAQFETVRVYTDLRTVIGPLIIGAWLMAWRQWFQVRRRWAHPLAIGAIVALMYITTWARSLAAMLMLAIIVAGRRRPTAMIAAVLVSVGLFAPELSALGLQGIWFPFGVGVSRTQFAYAAFDVTMFIICIWAISNSLPATSRSTS
jgi:hypothetical protein